MQRVSALVERPQSRMIAGPIGGGALVVSGTILKNLYVQHPLGFPLIHRIPKHKARNQSISSQP